MEAGGRKPPPLRLMPTQKIVSRTAISADVFSKMHWMDNAFGRQELIADNRDEINNWRIALGPVMGERWASLPEQSPGIASAVPTTALAPLEVPNQPIPTPQ